MSPKLTRTSRLKVRTSSTCSFHDVPKATLLNMPLAIAVASDWSNYASLPEDYASIFYWWAPDPTFLRRARR